MSAILAVLVYNIADKMLIVRPGTYALTDSPTEALNAAGV